MIKIKVTSCCPNWDWKRQTPHNDGIWNNTRFVFNKNIEYEFDYWIVFENLSKTETIVCNPKNTILITGEPPSVKTYHPKFLNQFGTVITCHKNIKHPNKILSHLSLPWMIGYQPQTGKFQKSYSELTNTQPSKKTKLLSVISSDKKLTKGHKKRLLFVQQLKKHFYDKIDIFGRGINDFNDKWDAIAPYKYHIALENSFFDNYWTEKLADSFLANTYPIYYGCPNTKDYFSENSHTKIDIYDPKEAIEIIEKTIEENVFEKSKADLEQAKNLVLNKYNFFPRMTKFCQTKPKDTKKFVELKPHEHFYKHDPIIKKIFYKTKNVLFGK